MRFVFIALVVFLAIGLTYVRMIPSDPAHWHAPIEGTGDADFATGALRVVAGSPELLVQSDAFMRGLERTKVLAGHASQGRVTYITRSEFFGFPDYTTIELNDGRLKAYARLRFGASDMGVNRKRLEGLFAALQGG